MSMHDRVRTYHLGRVTKIYMKEPQKNTGNTRTYVGVEFVWSAGDAAFESARPEGRSKIFVDLDVTGFPWPVYYRLFPLPKN